MAGNTTGFQKTFKLRTSADYPTCGTDQAVTYGANHKEVIVPTADNEIPVGVVTYQDEDRDGMHVGVQLDRIAEVVTAEAVAYGDELIVAAGGTVKKAAGTANANVLGVAQNSAALGEKVQVLIRPYVRP